MRLFVELVQTAVVAVGELTFNLGVVNVVAPGRSIKLKNACEQIIPLLGAENSVDKNGVARLMRFEPDAGNAAVLTPE